MLRVKLGVLPRSVPAVCEAEGVAQGLCPELGAGAARRGAARQAVLFVQEMASILVTPLLLWRSLPGCAADIIAFVRAFSAHVEGVGHVCSLATFDFPRHGDGRYGAPFHAPRAARSAQARPAACTDP